MKRYVELARQLFDWKALRVHRQTCPLCNCSVQLKFGHSEHAVRCLCCRANPAAMSMAEVLLDHVPDLGTRTVYELSSRGPLFSFLQENSGNFVFSEYFDGVPPGSTVDGVLCQDVQNLTFPDQVFDICTSTDVFEHVPDDEKAFGEIFRVLRSGGYAVFTVPLDFQQKTVERAAIVDGEISHLMPPEFHHDHISGLGKVLCFRNYGFDIVDKLESRGFKHVSILPPDDSRWWGYGRHVVVAGR